MKKTSPKPKDLFFSICIPVYNGASVIGETLKSVFLQSFDNYEIIVVDDRSKDKTIEVVKSLRDKRIKIFRNKKNLGYPKNLEKCRKKAKGEIIFLMGQDDILAKGALINTYKAFKISSDIGAVTRPYFWFDKNVKTPVRAKSQLNPEKDEVIRITDKKERLLRVFQTLDQFSGLAFRKKYLDLPFHEDIFPSHVYPFASILKKQPVVFLKGYSLAVRIGTSQARSSRIYGRKRATSYIYDKSPIQSWADMFKSVYREEKFREFREWMIKNFVAANYIGLVQIRNYGRYKYLLREIWLLIKYRWINLFSPSFWFFSLGCMIMPPLLLIPLVDWYKNRINSRFLKKIKFNYP